jgi:hypothetical protein
MTDYKNKYIKYKLKYLNLVGGVPSQEIDLLSCSKYSLFTKNKLVDGQYFTADSFLKKRTAFTNLNTIICYKINEIELNPNIKEIFVLLYNLVDKLNDFVEFIKIFENVPFNESVLVKQITDMFNKFSFKFNINNLLVFLLKFLQFLQEFIIKIKSLFKNILSPANDKITELNFEKFKYFSINFENYNVFHNTSYIYSPTFFNVLKLCYVDILKLIDNLKINFNKNIEAILKIFEDIEKLKNSPEDNLQTIFNTYEIRLRAGIELICIKLEEIVKVENCTDFTNNIKLFKNSNKYIKNDNTIILNRFYSLIESFVKDTKCTKDNKLKIYGLLNRIGFILKFLSTPQNQKEINGKMNVAFNYLSYYDQLLVKTKPNSINIEKLKVKIIEWEKSLKCVDSESLIHKIFKDFKDLNFLNIDRVDIENINQLNNEVKKLVKGDCKNKLESIMKEINEILL